jgi:hypothetical protein
MDNSKPRTATLPVIKSIIWAIAMTFAIIGSIEMSVYGRDGVPYFIIAGIFVALWGLLEAREILHRKTRPPVN